MDKYWALYFSGSGINMNLLSWNMAPRGLFTKHVSCSNECQHVSSLLRITQRVQHSLQLVCGTAINHELVCSPLSIQWNLKAYHKIRWNYLTSDHIEILVTLIKNRTIIVDKSTVQDNKFKIMKYIIIHVFAYRKLNCHNFFCRHHRRHHNHISLSSWSWS